MSADCSVGLAAGFAAWTCGFTPVSRAGLLSAEAGANVGAGAMAVTGALSSSFPSTTIGAVRCVEASVIFASISWRMRVSRAALEVPPRTTATMCRSSRRTEQTRLYPEAWV